MEKKILAYPVHLLRRFVLGAAISSMALALPAPLEAIDVVKQALAGQQADVPFAEQRRQINTYQLRRAELIRRSAAAGELNRQLRSLATSQVNVIANKFGIGAVSRQLFGNYSDRQLRRVLMEVRANDERMYNDVVASQPNSARRAELLSHAIEGSRLYASALNEMANDEQRQHLNEYQVDQIRRNLVVNFQEDARFRDVVQADLGEIQTELNTFDDQLAGQQEQLLYVSQHLSEHNRMIGDLADEVEQLQDQTIALNTSNAQLEANDQFTHGLLYNLLPAEQKLEALENDRFLYDHFTPEEREQTKARLEVEVQARKVVETVGQITAATQAVAQGLAQFGLIDQEDLADVNKAVGITTATFQIGASIATGNILGVVTGISGLFGGGGGSGLSEAIQAELEQINQKLDIVIDKLDEIDRKVGRVIELQQDTLVAIEELERRSIEGFDSVERSIKGVQWELSIIRDLILSESFGGVTLEECEIFANSRKNHDTFTRIEHSGEYVPTIVNFDIGEFSDWGMLASHYQSNMDEWVNCYGAIRRKFRDRNSIPDRFRMASYSRDNREGSYSSYIEPGFNPLSQLLARHFPLAGNNPRSEAIQAAMRTFCALLNAPDSYDTIDSRGHRFAHRDYFNYCRYDVRKNKMNPIATLIEGSIGPQLIHPDSFIFYTYLMMEILPYRGITTSSNTLLSPEEVARSNRPDAQAIRNEINEIVLTAYRLTNITIAQQALLAGDFMLPVLHGYLSNPDADDELRNNAIAILNHNEHIARNYLVMQFHRELRRRINPRHANLSDDAVLAANLDKYERIYHCRTNSNRGTTIIRGNEIPCLPKSELAYEQLFDPYWQFSSDTNEVMFGDEPFPMPSPQEIAAQHYHTTQEYQELLVLRSKILDFALRNDLPFVKDPDAIVDNDGIYKWL